MTYAVISAGGKQYQVAEGQLIRIEKILAEVGSHVSLGPVLMLSDGESLKVGQPTLSDVTVTGKVVEQSKAKKIIVFKYKRRKRYRRKYGHRQPYTAILVDAIQAV